MTDERFANGRVIPESRFRLVRRGIYFRGGAFVIRISRRLFAVVREDTPRMRGYTLSGGAIHRSLFGYSAHARIHPAMQCNQKSQVWFYRARADIPVSALS